MNAPVVNTLLIGIGNDFRGDDAAGLLVARGLVAKGIPGLTILESDGEALSLLESWQDAGRLILVDATEPAEDPGATLRFDAGAEALPSQPFLCSTHAFNLAESIELARSLGRLPPEVIVYGIQGKNFGMGAGITPVVLEAVNAVVETIQTELQ